VIDSIPTSMGGLPEGLPPRSATPAPFPAVHDMPPPRADARMSEAEKKRLRDELLLNRNKIEQAATAGYPTGGTAGAASKP
jgi:hypothetical protein